MTQPVDTNKTTRTETDSMGDVQVPVDSLYGAQTQRALSNFTISQLRMPKYFLRALGLVKWACASVNRELGLLDSERAQAIEKAALAIVEGHHDREFPIDIFQTGSGTSTNMNANEVIANLAVRDINCQVHPNDHVNMSQSSNDVIPTALHVSAYLDISDNLLPALQHLLVAIEQRASTLSNTVKMGRTHLMDALPLSLAQELSGWAQQIQHNINRLEGGLNRLAGLAQGATAVGTGLNAPSNFGELVALRLAEKTGKPFYQQSNLFAALSAQDTLVEFSGYFNTLAVSLSKISNDLRWMNSGPLAGLAEIELTALQPGSSIMPGKVNPVIPEAVAMAAAQVMGNHTTITVAGQSGNFQLNVMLPLFAYNVLQSIELLSNSARALADQAIVSFRINDQKLANDLARNPMLATALNRHIGYEQGAAIVKKAYQENRMLLDVAKEMTNIDEAILKVLLDPKRLTQAGIPKSED